MSCQGHVLQSVVLLLTYPLNDEALLITVIIVNQESLARIIMLFEWIFNCEEKTAIGVANGPTYINHVSSWLRQQRNHDW